MKYTRPFNAEYARAGAPYACRDGLEATVLKWDRRSEKYPLIGVYGTADAHATWTADGLFSNDEGTMDRDLVMTPLGYVEGKPFFCGDKLIGPYSGEFVAEPRDKDGDHALWRWPPPAKQYPQSQADYLDLTQAALKTNSAPICITGSQVLTIANAAIRHAIDAGQVVTKEDYKADLVRLGDSLRPVSDEIRTARDMAIAEAVRNWCIDVAKDAPNLPTASNIILRANLTSIIEKVGK